jgi:hypothetical protein
MRSDDGVRRRPERAAGDDPSSSALPQKYLAKSSGINEENYRTSTNKENSFR